MAESSPIGRSFRWRNQATVFDADDSEKLYLALAGPFGPEGQQCMILPNKSRRILTAVGLKNKQATTLWSQRLDGFFSSNLSGAQTPSGTVALGFGTSNGKLRIWQANDASPFLYIEPFLNEIRDLKLTLIGARETSYTLQSSSNLIEWNSFGECILTGTTKAITTLSAPNLITKPQAFVRAQEARNLIFANIDSVETSGEDDYYSFQATVSSPDTGCEQYADWWEVLTDKGELLYRRVLLHSHVSEQPFHRSGGRGGIRTPDAVSRTPDFESGTFNQLSHPSRACFGVFCSTG
jgi:hypothetical protein